MAIFKRFEVWLLLVLSIAGAGYVLWSEKRAEENGDGPGSPSAGGPVEEKPKRFQIRDLHVVEEGESKVIEIELLGRNDRDEPEELTSDTIRLLARYEGGEKESELPSFFLPFQPPPILAPKSESIVTLKYWLEPRSGKSDPSLTLEVGEESFRLSLARSTSGEVFLISIDPC